MIQKIKQLFLKRKMENKTVGGLVPVVACIKYSSRMSELSVKEMIAHKMGRELMNYIYFEKEEQDNGVILLKGRIDVLRRDNIQL